MLKQTTLSLDMLSIPAATSEKLSAPDVTVPLAHPLNPDQMAAVEAMVAFIQDPHDDDFFLLEGPAGTGKTFCVKALINRIKGRLVFTAPTNKATKVLRESVEAPGYKPECRTIYSLLGLKLEPNGEIKELTAAEDPLDLSQFAAVVVDEGSMLNSTLGLHMRKAAKEQNVRFILMGDRFQLRPVGEEKSWIWTTKRKVELSRVMRHDNQILALATHIRERMMAIAPNANLVSANDGEEGVWVMGTSQWLALIAEYAEQGWFSRPNMAKVIAWRNVTVDRVNGFIRKQIFGETESSWVVGDRLIMTAPAKDFEGEQVAHTDDEGEVTQVNVAYHPIYGEVKCYALTVTFDDNHQGTVWLLHEDSLRALNAELERKAALARKDGKLWQSFWALKDSFHAARYAYAITAHRSQGSTYTVAFVDYRDILVNRNRHEAFQCLYVGVTRPKKCLFLA